MAQHGSKDLDLPKVKINKSNFKLFVRIFNYAGSHTWKFYLGLVFLGFTGATALLFPVVPVVMWLNVRIAMCLSPITIRSHRPPINRNLPIYAATIATSH